MNDNDIHDWICNFFDSSLRLFPHEPSDAPVPAANVEEFVKIIDLWMSLHPEISLDIEADFTEIITGKSMEKKTIGKLGGIIRKAKDKHWKVRGTASLLKMIKCHLFDLVESSFISAEKRPFSLYLKPKRRNISKDSAVWMGFPLHP